MMKKEKRHCRVARNHPLTDLAAIEDDLLGFEANDDQRSLLRKMQKGQRLKSYVQFLLVWVLLLAGYLMPDHAVAQTTPNPFAAPYLDLKTSLIPSGILHNRSPYYTKCFVPDSTFQLFSLNPDYPASPYLFGTGIIEMQPGTFLKLYEDMLYAQIHDSVIINPEDYHNALVAARQTADVPISLMGINFQRMTEDAILSGKVWFDTVAGTFGPFPDTMWIPDTIQAVDTLFVPDSTYYLLMGNSDSLLALAFETYQLFGMLLPEQFVFLDDTSGTIRFSTPTNLFVTNFDSLPSIQINFDDGGGFRPVEWNSFIDINYTLSAVPKIHTKMIRVRYSFCHMDMELRSDLQIVVNTIKPDTVINTLQLPFLCLPNTPSQPSEGKISVLFADKAKMHLTKPVLFVEGFETAANPYGKITFQNVMNQVMPELGFPEIGEMPLLFDSLLTLGFDIIYLDFLNSRDSLERNMLAVIAAIQWANEQLQMHASNEKLVVAAASMGGLLTRMALRQMELDGCCHNTRLYISFDAPHQGANIPLALQQMVNLAADQSEAWQGMSNLSEKLYKILNVSIDLSNEDVVLAKKYVLNSPAARAMLMLHTDPDAQVYHKAFYEKLDQMGYPQYCGRISLINGSENGVWHQLEDPYGRLFKTGEVMLVPTYWKVLSYPLNIPAAWYYAPNTSVSYPLGYSAGYDETKLNYFVASDWGKALDDFISLEVNVLSRTALNVAFGAVTALAPWMYPATEGMMMANKKRGNWNQNNYLQSGVFTYHPSTGLPPLTTAPGGLNDALKKLGGAANSDLKVYSPKFSFVPSISALDVKGGGLNYNIIDNYKNSAIKHCKFDAYWAPRRLDSLDDIHNQMHVQVTYANRHWIIDHILHDWALRSTTGRYAGVLNGYFNYGKPANQQDIVFLNQPLSRILYSLEIGQGGALHVNRQGDVGEAGSMLLPKPMSTFRVDACGDACDPAIVRVNFGGSVVLGDQYNYNSGELVFHPGSVLELLPGSQLLLYRESRLVIEPGATLIVHPGAGIILHDAGSVLEIRGKLVLHDNTELTFTGGGFLRFNPAMTSASVPQHFTIGQGASIKLEGQGMAGKRIEIASDTWFPESLPIRITLAAVEIHEGVTLSHQGPLYLDQVWVRAIDTTGYYGALATFGQPDVMIKNSLFSHGTIGFFANLSIGGTPLVIRDCEFRKNITALRVEDERLLLQRCGFFHNHSGVEAYRMAGQSRIEHCQFLNNHSGGIWFAGQVASGLRLLATTITGSYNGVEIYDGMLQAECSNITGNTEAGIWGGKHSRIRLGNNARNQITSNLFGIVLDNALELDLLGGANNFTGNAYFVVGELPAHLFSANNACQVFDFTGNHMPYLGNQMPVELWYQDPNTGLQVQLGVVMHAMASYPQTLCTSLSALPNGHILDPVLSVTGASLLTGGRFAAQTMAGALYQSAALVSCEGYTGNDTLAIACLDDLLSNLPGQLNDSEREGVEYALMLMNEALSNAVAMRWIDPNRALDGMVPDEYVARVRDRVQQRLDEANASPMTTEEAEARYALMLAQMFRVAEHYDYALAVLNDEQRFEGTNMADDARYWDCICRTERLMLLDSIERSAYLNRIDSCSLHLQNARKRRIFPQTGYTQINAQLPETPLVEQVYPNPATRHLVIALSRSVEHCTAELTDPAGRTLFRHHKVWCGREVPLTLPELQPGTYLLKVTGDGVTSFHKVMIIQN